MTSNSKSTDLNINPDWLQEVFDEEPESNVRYISIKDVARAVGANPEGFSRYVRRKAIEPIMRCLNAHLTLCLTENEAKEIARIRLREGYSIPINRENGNEQ